MKIVKLFYDLETTGLNPKLHSIVQLSGLVEINNIVVEKFNFSVRPHPKAKIEQGALNIIGKTEAELMDYPPMTEVYQAFTHMLDKHVNRFKDQCKVYLVGFNNRNFDDAFLLKFFQLNDDPYFFARFYPDSLDTLILASQFLINRRPTMPSFKLRRVAMELGFTVDDEKLHDAMYDVELTRSIYRVVTGMEKKPAPDFIYYINTESGTAAKSFEPIDDPNLTMVSYFQFWQTLKELGVKDGAHLIYDDLF